MAVGVGVGVSPSLGQPPSGNIAVANAALKFNDKKNGQYVPLVVSGA